MKSESKIVWLVSFSHFITHGYMTILPAVLIAIAGEQSLSFVELGIIANIGYFLYGLGAFPAGWLADRFGSKRLLTVGMGSLATTTGGWIADNYSIDRFYALLALFAAAGMVTALAVYPLRSYAVDLQRKSKKIFKLSS